MKKLALFFVILIIIICGISYIYINYKVTISKSQKENLEFENYIKDEISGTDIATLINKAIDSNEINKVEKSDKGIYLDNNKNSINIEMRIIDNNKTYKMETIYNNGIQDFVRFYGNIKFKCKDIKYHNSTNKIKYILFEQITE